MVAADASPVRSPDGNGGSRAQADGDATARGESPLTAPGTAASISARLGAQGVTRRFGRILANDTVDLSVAPGTIHGVVGENGAGKTTLMRILYGFDRPDSGRVIVDDEPVELSSPADGLARGIGMVHQEFMLVPELTLLENLVLGAEPTRGPLVDWAAARTAAARLSDDTGVELDWDRPVARSSVSARQRLEILRLLHQGVDTLILDEPTAVLAPAQVAELFRLLRSLRDNGHTIVFISHKLDEVLALADRVTVLRGGQAVATVEADSVDAGHLAELIVGAALPEPTVVEPGDRGAAVLRVGGLHAVDDRGMQRLRDVSLDVHAGEIVGVAGVSDNGQDELVECLVGLRSPTDGTITLDGTDISTAPVADRRARGLSYISADRAREGLALDASVADNVIAGAHRRAPLASWGRLRLRRVRSYVSELLSRYHVRGARPAQPARALSGGNQQRLVIGRELSRSPHLLVASQPTRGIDVAGIRFVHTRLAALRDEGCGILLVSEELDELLALSDRIVVLLRGQVVGEVSGHADQRAEVGRLMTVQAGGASW
jgi:simple sugar transport system ATP-binding protein